MRVIHTCKADREDEDRPEHDEDERLRINGLLGGHVDSPHSRVAGRSGTDVSPLQAERLGEVGRTGGERGQVNVGGADYL
jgi:hypothetical protein